MVIRQLEKIIIGFIIASFLSATLPDYAFAKKGSSKNSLEAIIIQVEGDVKIRATKEKEWREAEARLRLSKDDMLKTAADSWAEVGFGEELKNVIKVKEETTVKFTEVGPIVLGLLNGEIRSLVEALTEDSTFQIRTPTAVCGARGTGWDTATDGEKVIIDAYEENVFFQPVIDGKVGAESIIEAGKRAVLKDPSIPFTLEDLPADKLEAWNQWKELLPEKLKVMRRYVEMTQDRLFAEAQKSYEKALWYIKKGDGLFRKGFGTAREAYEHAENYLIETKTFYVQLERTYGLDMRKEKMICEELYEDVHVKVGQVTRKTPLR